MEDFVHHTLNLGVRFLEVGALFYLLEISAREIYLFFFKKGGEH